MKSIALAGALALLAQPALAGQPKFNVTLVAPGTSCPAGSEEVLSLNLTEAKFKACVSEKGSEFYIDHGSLDIVPFNVEK